MLVPILMKDMLPGDKFSVNLHSLIESLPMIAPSLSGWKANFDFYFEPWSNLYGFMDNNVREDTSALANMVRHNAPLGHYIVADAENASDDVQSILSGDKMVTPGSFMDYMGFPPGFIGEWGAEGLTPLPVPMEKWLGYLDIYRNYYVNNQEGEAYMCDSAGSVYNADTDVAVQSYPLDAYDEIFRYLRYRTAPLEIEDLFDKPAELSDDAWRLMTLPFILPSPASRVDLGQPFAGLALRTYRMDLNRGLMSTDVGELQSRVMVGQGSFSIDTLRFANKMQKFIDRFDVSGGRFSDWMRTQWSVKVRGQLDIPDYLGTVSEFFGNADVICTSNGAVSTSTGVKEDAKLSVLGQQAGFAVGNVNRDNRPISFKADQYGTFYCIFSLVPIVNYSQGVERENIKVTFNELFNPAFSQLGFQDVRRLELSALPSIDSDYRINFDESSYDLVGKQVAWAEYMASLPRAHGLFAYGQEFDYWANQRMYTMPRDDSEAPSSSASADIKALWNARRPYGQFDRTTYILPGTVNYLFASTAATDSNFRLRVKFDIHANRPIGNRLMPHL